MGQWALQPPSQESTMYHKILVALENGSADVPLLAHAHTLATHTGAEILLLHVADGFGARYFQQLKLAESEEMRDDRKYLEEEAERLRGKGLVVHTLLALGNPPQEILKAAKATGCDLIAMGSHGHRWLGDLFHGSTIYAVRHDSSVPVLVVPATRKE